MQRRSLTDLCHIHFLAMRPLAQLSIPCRDLMDSAFVVRRDVTLYTVIPIKPSCKIEIAHIYPFDPVHVCSSLETRGLTFAMPNRNNRVTFFQVVCLIRRVQTSTRALPSYISVSIKPLVSRLITEWDPMQKFYCPGPQKLLSGTQDMTLMASL